MLQEKKLRRMFEPTEIIVIWPQLFNFDGICEHIACAMWTAIFDVAHKNTEVKFGVVHAGNDRRHFWAVPRFDVRHIAP